MLVPVDLPYTIGKSECFLLCVMGFTEKYSEEQGIFTRFDVSSFYILHSPYVCWECMLTF